jgi:hypothetical protein
LLSRGRRHHGHPSQARARNARKISLLARAGLLVWFTGVIAPSLADARHWPAREIGQVNGVEYACKMTGFALLAADLALLAIASRSRRTPWAGSRTMSGDIIATQLVSNAKTKAASKSGSVWGT